MGEIDPGKSAPSRDVTTWRVEKVYNFLCEKTIERERERERGRGSFPVDLNVRETRRKSFQKLPRRDVR